MITYVTLFFIVAGMAFALYYRSEERTRFLRRDADDIAAALKAGERWRADIRAAHAMPQADEKGIHLRNRTEDIHYFTRDNAVWRQVADRRPVLMLGNVKNSAMLKEQRQIVAGWKWDVELLTRQKNARVRPLFTFFAVQEKGATP